MIAESSVKEDDELKLTDAEKREIDAQVIAEFQQEHDKDIEATVAIGEGEAEARAAEALWRQKREQRRTELTIAKLTEKKNEGKKLDRGIEGLAGIFRQKQRGK